MGFVYLVWVNGYKIGQAKTVQRLKAYGNPRVLGYQYVDNMKVAEDALLRLFRKKFTSIKETDVSNPKEYFECPSDEEALEAFLSYRDYVWEPFFGKKNLQRHI